MYFVRFGNFVVDCPGRRGVRELIFQEFVVRFGLKDDLFFVTCEFGSRRTICIKIVPKYTIDIDYVVLDICVNNSVLLCDFVTTT